jgi:dihydrofolate reductase
MSKVRLEITMSVDGFVAGPDRTVEQPLGADGEGLHEWIFRLASWRESHGQEGGERGEEDELLRESIDATGAYLMGRRMFSGGEGSWEDDPVAEGWWGDDPPFGVPVFILTHHPREPLVKGDTTFTFVTEGIEAALSQAQTAAGEKDVKIAGGASVAQQYLSAGLLDEVELHIAPALLGDGVRLFDDLGDTPPRLEVTRVLDSPFATHIRYRVAR